MKKVLCPGEALIDFVATEGLGNLEDSNNFTKKAGGAPVNAAGAMAKLGVEAYFMGAVGNDPFGNFLKKTMETYNIKTDYLDQIDDKPTTLAFVSLTADGERDFKFNRGADAKLEIQAVKSLDKFDCVHFASATAFMGEGLETSYDILLQYAKQKNKLISFDANYRDALFGDNQEKFISKCKEYIASSDIVKLSDEEAMLISGETDLVTAGEKLQKLSGKYMLITLGSNGTYLFYTQGMEHITTEKVEMVDSTGAGDAFIGTVIALAIQEQTLGLERMKKIVKIANKVGAITTQSYGALESIPSLSELNIE